MTEFSFTNSNNNNINEKNNKSSSSDFTNLCSFISSHPLYFSYLIFFSPYLYKLVSFLSPLFLTTFLLFLSLVTTLIPLKSILNPKDGFFLTAYATVIENFRPGFDNEADDEKLLAMDEFEVYRVVFDVPTTSIVLSEENPVENETFGENPDDFFCELGEKIVDHGESLTIEPETGDTNPNKVGEEREKKEEGTVKSSGSEVNKVEKAPKFGSLKVNSSEKPSETFPQTVGEQQCLGGFGSMRREKEWRRTLACKLFEERHNWSSNKINPNRDGEDCMDLLWETDETEKNRGNFKEKEDNNHNHNNSKKKLKTKDDKMEDLMKNENCDDESEESDDYEIGKICCLQALKLSAGKMNLSMAKPNLVKFSKAFKGIGWLHSHVRKQGKKGYK